MRRYSTPRENLNDEVGEELEEMIIYTISKALLEFDLK